MGEEMSVETPPKIGRASESIVRNVYGWEEVN